MQQLHVARSLFNLSAAEHALLCSDHDLWRQRRHLPKQPRIVDETGDVAGYEAVHHAAHTDHLAGKDSGVDGGFAVVAHHATQELHAGRGFAKWVFHIHGAVRVLQVGIASAGTEIDPAA